MKISIRQGVFETNSSSVHSCSITTDKTYDDFLKGKVWIRQQWNDEDEYLEKEEAIKRNVEYFKENADDIDDADWVKFEEVYKETNSLDEAFNAIGVDWQDIKYDYDYDDYFLSYDDYWDIHEYEDWSHEFTDTAGVRMVAWGYCGHD